MTTRRDFLSRSTLGLAGLALTGWASPALAAESIVSERGNLPILQAWTTEKETEIKILRPQNRRYFYRALGSDGRELPMAVLNEFTFRSSVQETADHLRIEGLVLGERYRLQVTDEHHVLDEREFAALDLSKRSAKLALLSCMFDVYFISQKLMWAAVARSEPDMLLFIGDACYADFNSDSTPSAIWRRHCESRRSLDVYYFKKLIPSIAVWDDHDFGLNNSNGTFPYKADSLRIFDALFGSASRDRYIAGPVAARFANAFGLRIALMDDRYHRSPSRAPGGTHWGEEQEGFLFEQLQSQTLPTLLCNGSQFFGGYRGKESYEGDHPEAFERMLNALASASSPVVFCSGDVHYSEIMKIEPELLGYPTWELTSSSVHSMSIPGMQAWWPNSRRVRSASAHNFLLLHTHTEPSDPSKMRFRAECIGKFGRQFHFSETLEA